MSPKLENAGALTESVNPRPTCEFQDEAISWIGLTGVFATRGFHAYRRMLMSTNRFTVDFKHEARRALDRRIQTQQSAEGRDALPGTQLLWFRPSDRAELAMLPST